MKRGDIQIGPVYGYSEDRKYITRYQPVILLSLDSYERARYGTKLLAPTHEPREKLNRGGWRTHTNPVGLLGVMLTAGTDHDTLRRVRALVSVEEALAAQNGQRENRSVVDPDDPEHELGRYILVTATADLQGDYAELTAALEAAEDARARYADAAEQARVADVARYNELADRLDRLGVTGYHASGWESPHGRFEKLTFDDLELLIVGAENFYSEYPDSHPKHPEWPGKKA